MWLHFPSMILRGVVILVICRTWLLVGGGGFTTEYTMESLCSHITKLTEFLVRSHCDVVVWHELCTVPIIR